MLYLCDPFYRAGLHFDLIKAIRAIFEALSPSLEYYEAEVLVPLTKTDDHLIKSGRLPTDIRAKLQTLNEVLQWLEEHSLGGTASTSKLLVDSQAVQDHNPLFAYWDGPCCWTLNLSAEQFVLVQKSLRKAGIPSDLFYPKTKHEIIPYQPKSFMGKILAFIFPHSTTSISPRQKEAQKK